MKTIVVATDFSSAAENAMTYGAHMAQDTGALLCLLHAYQVPVGMADMPILMVTDEEMKKNSDAGLQQAKELVQKNIPDLTIETESRLGDIVDEINGYCKGKDVFAIVIGTKNFEGLEKFLFGNTAAAIVRHCIHPVISVPSSAHANTPKNVVLATDLTNVHEVPAAGIIEIVQSLNAKLHIVHITEGEEKNTEVSEQLMNLLKDVNPLFFSVADKNVLHGLQTYVQQNNIDLLLALPHKHNLYERLFFKLHTEGLIDKMPIPVMCLQNA